MSIEVNKLHKVLLLLSIWSMNLATSKEVTKKRAAVIITNGAEDTECVIAVDILKRAGVNVAVVGRSSYNPVYCQKGTAVVPDLDLKDAKKKGLFDAVILPGGTGYKKFYKTSGFGAFLRKHERRGRLIAAISTAPAILNYHKIGHGKIVTSHPSVKDELTEEYEYQEKNVVEDGKIITSRGPGTAFDFALAIAGRLVGKDVAESVAKDMLL